MYRNGFVQRNVKTAVSGSIFEFGTLGGNSSRHILLGLKALNIPVKKFYAFDKFDGLPMETAEPIWEPSWDAEKRPDVYSLKARAGLTTTDQCVEYVKGHIATANRDVEVIVVPGLFSDVLNDDLIEKHNPEPAFIVSVDCDIYSSTIESLDWMFEKKLIIPGTYFIYDDWGGTPHENFDNGESRAHREVAEKYKVKFRHLETMGSLMSNATFRSTSIARMFVVESIGEGVSYE
jgi:hypothetical protein